jgi:2-oxoglutarate ferredoxin oxidoreductase subunit alpha
MHFDYLRVRAYPFADEIRQFIARHKRVYVVDQNRDAQMLQLLKLDLEAGEIAKLRSVRHYNGLPIDARYITDEIVLQEGSKNGERTQFAA